MSNVSMWPAHISSGSIGHGFFYHIAPQPQKGTGHQKGGTMSLKPNKSPMAYRVRRGADEVDAPEGSSLDTWTIILEAAPTLISPRS